MSEKGEDNKKMNQKNLEEEIEDDELSLNLANQLENEMLNQNTFNNQTQDNNILNNISNINSNIEPQESKNNQNYFSFIPKISKQNEEEDIKFNNIQNVDENIDNSKENEDKKLSAIIPKANSSITETKNTTNLFTVNKIENSPSISTILSNADLDCELDLDNIVEKNPQIAIKENGVFKRVRMIIFKKQKISTFIYKTGKILCYGAKSVEDSKRACYKCAEIIKNCGYKVKDIKPEIKNIAGNYKFNFKISLKKLYENLKKEKVPKVSYDPENFPGVTYYIKKNSDSKLVSKIFPSGKIIITGAKDEKEFHDAFETIKTMVLKYKK